MTSADEKSIRHSRVRRAEPEESAPVKAGNLGWCSFCVVLDTRLRGYDVSLIDDFRDKAKKSGKSCQKIFDRVCLGRG